MHEPLYIEGKRLLICQTPKAGSLYVRGVVEAFERQQPFQWDESNKPYDGLYLLRAKARLDLAGILLGSSTRRIMRATGPPPLTALLTFIYRQR